MRLAHTRSGKGSAVAIAIAALCLLGPILSYAHMLLVAHARCPEHGELLHLAAPAGGQPGPESGTSEGEPTALSEASLPGESHEHDHCVVASARKTEAAVKSAGPTLAIANPRSQHPPDQGPGACPPIALYVLAPKNSPPV